MVLKCIKCDKVFDLPVSAESDSWTLVESTERNMGTEHRYQQDCLVECPHCKSRIEAKLCVWEYPEGVFNMQDVEIEGANVEGECFLGDFLTK